MQIQIDDQVRNATADEAAQIKQLQQSPTLADHIAAVEAAKTTARAKLAALGLTEAEIAALIGA